MKMRRRLLPILAMWLACCGDERMAGGSDDVENPALHLSLLDSLNNPYRQGVLQVYARYQSPLSDSLPALSLPVNPQAATVITDSVLLEAMNLAKKRGIPWNRDTLEFNVVAVSPEQEAFGGQFWLVKEKPGRYAFRRYLGKQTQFPNARGVLSGKMTVLPPVPDYRGQVGAKGLELDLQSVFIPGSPYHSPVAAGGGFALPRMAAGKYQVMGVAKDSTVFMALDSLDTDSAFAPSTWTEAEIIWIEGG
jgi:hypothetical protein